MLVRGERLSGIIKSSNITSQGENFWQVSYLNARQDTAAQQAWSGASVITTLSLAASTWDVSQ